MGREKDESLQKEENWKRKARNDGRRCAVCGNLIEHADTDTFFSKKMRTVSANTCEKFQRDD